MMEVVDRLTELEHELKKELKRLDDRERSQRRFEAACHAMQALVGREMDLPSGSKDMHKTYAVYWAENAVACADALLAELERTEKNDG